MPIDLLCVVVVCCAKGLLLPLCHAVDADAWVFFGRSDRSETLPMIGLKGPQLVLQPRSSAYEIVRFLEELMEYNMGLVFRIRVSTNLS